MSLLWRTTGHVIQAFGHQQGPLNRTEQEQTSSVWKSKQSRFNGSFLPTKGDSVRRDFNPRQGWKGALSVETGPGAKGDAAFRSHPGVWFLHKSLWPVQGVCTIRTVSGKCAPECSQAS